MSRPKARAQAAGSERGRAMRFIVSLDSLVGCRRPQSTLIFNFDKRGRKPADKGMTQLNHTAHSQSGCVAI